MFEMAGPRSCPKIKTFSKPSPWLSDCPCRPPEIRLLANSGAILGGNSWCCVHPVLVAAERINWETVYKALELIHITQKKKYLGLHWKVGTTQGFSFRKASWVTWKVTALHSSADESTKTTKSFCRRERAANLEDKCRWVLPFWRVTL